MLTSYGIELKESSLGDLSQNLHAALGCFDSALEVRTREAFPQDWAATHFGKCLALAESKDGKGALQELELALEGYRQIGNSYRLQQAEELKQYILNAMSASNGPPAA